MTAALDTVRAFETPEGVELHLRTAGLAPRALAWTLDTLIRIGAYIALAFMLLDLGNLGLGLFFIALFAMEWFYPVLFEVLWQGATPGKRALGIKVVHDDGTPVGWPASLVRNLLRFVDFLPLLYGVGILSLLFSTEPRRLGDHVAGTLVVYRAEPAQPLPLPEARPRPPSRPLLPDEQQAVVHYAERMAGMNGERAQELARLAAPLVAQAADPMAELAAIARHITGGTA
jgi:uncharacterized RDD family membrane protein YckC